MSVSYLSTLFVWVDPQEHSHRRVRTTLIRGPLTRFTGPFASSDPLFEEREISFCWDPVGFLGSVWQEVGADGSIITLLELSKVGRVLTPSLWRCERKVAIKQRHHVTSRIRWARHCLGIWEATLCFPAALLA